MPWSKRIIERHGGRIWLESTPGGGSTFYFTLNFRGDDPPPAAGATRAREPQTGVAFPRWPRRPIWFATRLAQPLQIHGNLQTSRTKLLSIAMESDTGDIQKAMGVDSQRSGAVERPEGNRVQDSGTLGPAEFSARFEMLRGVFWLIAAGVLGGRGRGKGGGGQDDAEDVVQEAAVIGLRKLAEFETSTSDGGFAAWMGQIVRNVARNHARKQRRRRTHATDPQDLDRSGDGDPVEPVDGRLDQHVLEALNELDEIPRTCLLLRTVREMSYRDISCILEIPEGTAMSHVHRARKTLRARLTERDSGTDRRPA